MRVFNVREYNQESVKYLLTNLKKKALLYPVRLPSGVRSSNFLSEREAQTKSGLSTLDGQHVNLPLNVTLAIRSHLPRRWETVFRWTMKAIIGPLRSAASLQTGENLTGISVF